MRYDAQLCKTLKNAMDDDGDDKRDLKGEAEAMTEKLTNEKEALMEQLKPLMLHNRRMGHYSVLGRNVTKMMDSTLRQTPYS